MHYWGQANLGLPVEFSGTVSAVTFLKNDALRCPCYALNMPCFLAGAVFNGASGSIEFLGGINATRNTCSVRNEEIGYYTIYYKVICIMGGANAQNKPVPHR